MGGAGDGEVSGYVALFIGFNVVRALDGPQLPSPSSVDGALGGSLFVVSAAAA